MQWRLLTSRFRWSALQSHTNLCIPGFYNCGTPPPLFFFNYCILKRVNRNRNMLIGGWTTCEPSCEDVHNSLSPPGTLYFHGPASDVNAPAVLWIVRTDYSVGGEGTASLCGVCLPHVVRVCVCVRLRGYKYTPLCICVHVCVCLHVICKCFTCIWGVCVCVYSVQKACTPPWIRNVLKWMKCVMWG